MANHDHQNLGSNPYSIDGLIESRLGLNPDNDHLQFSSFEQQVNDDALLSNSHLDNGSMNVDNPFDDVTSGQNFDSLVTEQDQHLNEEQHINSHENEQPNNELNYVQNEENKLHRKNRNNSSKNLDSSERELKSQKTDQQNYQGSESEDSDHHDSDEHAQDEEQIPKQEEDDEMGGISLAEESRLIRFKIPANKFASEKDWSTDTVFSCYLCFAECEGFAESVTHIRQEHPEVLQGDKTAHCIVCPKVFARRDHLKNHLWRHVNRVRETPRHSMRTFRPGRPVQTKSAWCEMKEWTCRRCGDTVKGISEFVTHLDSFHVNDCGIVCPECDKEFPSKKRLKVHMVLHSDKKFTCPNCSKDFSEEYKLRRHVKEVHEGVKEHVCATCGKSFARADKLFQHELVHVTKSDRPVEWVPIQSDIPIPAPGMENENDDTSSDESSDSSSDETEGSEKESLDVSSFLQQPAVKEEWGEASNDDNDFLYYDDFLGDKKPKGTGISEKTPPKKRRGRPLGSRAVKAEAPEPQDWSLVDYEFSCHLCSESCNGFHQAVLHMSERHHEDGDENEKVHKCIFCSKSFARRDHLKNHVRRHVFTTSPQTNAASKGRPSKVALKIKSESSEGLSSPEKTAALSSHNWSEKIGWPCKRCDRDIKGLGKYVNHLEDFHPDDDALFCPFCERISFNARKDLRRHVVLEHKDVCPGVPSPDISKVTVKKEFMDELSQLENQDPETPKIEPIKKIKIKELLSQNSKLPDSDEPATLGEHFLLNRSAEAADNQIHSDGNEDFVDDDFVGEEEEDSENEDDNSGHLDEEGSEEEDEGSEVAEDYDEDQSEEDSEFSFDDDEYDENDFDEYPKKRKRGRPRKSKTRSSDSFDEDSKKWVTDFVFTCYKCSEDCQGYKLAVDHMVSEHDGGLAEDGSKQHLCALCPKVFGRRDHLKRHMYGHVENKAPKQRGRRPKEIEDEDLFDEDEVTEELAAEATDDAAETKRKLRRFKRKRIAENKSILETMDQGVNGNPAWSDSQQFTCLYCNESIVGVAKVIHHMNESHKIESPPQPENGDDEDDQPQLVLQCVLCPKTTDQLDLFKVHLWRHLNTVAPTMSTKSSTPRSPMKSWAETQKWSCKKCLPSKVEVDGLSSFIDHMKQVHKSSNGLTCPICDKDRFVRKEQLRFHIQVHNEVKRPCEFCGKLFAAGNKMRRHVAEVHEGRKNHMCNTCGKCFARSEKLRAHEIVHLPAEHKPFLCHQCGRGFGRQEHVSRHAKICGQKKTRIKQALYKANANPFDKELARVAVEYGLEYLQKDAETGYFNCIKCPRQSKEKRSIIEHYARAHCEEHISMPHRCEECGRGFKVIKDLMKHKKKPHTAEYLAFKYPCQIDKCGKRFRKEIALKRHMQMHEGIRPFKCDHCDQAFHIKQVLKRHMMLIHKIKAPREIREKKTSSSGTVPGSSGSKRPRSIPKKKIDKENFPGVDDEDLIDSKQREHQLAELHHHLSKTASGIESAGALNLSQNNQDGTTAHNHQQQQLQLQGNQQQNWMQSDYFGSSSGVGGSGSQFPFAHWMSMGLDQPPTMVPNTYSFGQGLRSELEDHNSRSYTPADSIHSTHTDHMDDAHLSSTPSNRDAFDVTRNRDWEDSWEAHASTATLPLKTVTSPTKNVRNSNSFLAETKNNHSPVIKDGSSLMTKHQQQTSQSDVESVQMVEARSASPTPEAKKKRKIPTILTDEEKHLVTVEMQESKLGSLCNICGKMLKNKDALNFHIMNTKLPGHEPALAQLVKNNYAQESMRVASKLSEAARHDPYFNEDPATPIVHNVPSPMPAAGYTPDLHIDPRTGVFVKQEPVDVGVTENDFFQSSNDDADFPAALSRVEVSLKSGSIKEENSSQQELDESLLMPPPTGLPPHRKKKPSKSSKNKIFKCCECHRAFKKVQKLVKHVERKHSNKPKQPKRPSQTSEPEEQQPSQLQQQQDMIEEQIVQVEAHPDEPSDVVIKSESPNATNRESVTSSEKSSLKLTPMGCPDCNVIFSAKDEMMRHFAQKPHKLADGISINHCPVLTCEITFTNRGKLIQHLRIGKHVQPCPQCGKTFKKMDQLEIHVRSHYTDRPYLCSKCDKSYKDSIALGSHMATHSGKRRCTTTSKRLGTIAPRPYLCSECGAGFMKSDHLKRHINSTHLKIKNIKCQFCDKFFGDKYKAKIHERMHTGEAPYLCSICAKAFKRKEALEHHSVVHRKDLPKDFKCVTCGATFISQQYLNRHVSRHFATKKHKCRFCSSAFIDRRDYLVHISHVHENQRPFSCPTCLSSYKTKQGLTTHHKAYPNGDCQNAKRTDNDQIDGDDSSSVDGGNLPLEKPFECSHCGKRFVKKSRLEWHLRMHNNERPFPCTADGCTKAFFANQTLRAHLKQVHHATLPSTTLKQNSVTRALSPDEVPVKQQQQQQQPVQKTAQRQQQQQEQHHLTRVPSVSEVVEHLTAADSNHSTSGRDSVLSTISQSSVSVIDNQSRDVTQHHHQQQQQQHQQQQQIQNQLSQLHEQQLQRHPILPINDSFHSMNSSRSRFQRQRTEEVEGHQQQAQLQQQQQQPRSIIEHRQQQLMEVMKDMRTPPLASRLSSVAPVAAAQVIAAVSPANVQSPASLFPSSHSFALQQQHERHVQEQLLLQQQHQQQQQQQRLQQQQQRQHQQQVPAQQLQHVVQQHHHVQMPNPTLSPSPLQQQQQQQQDLQAALGFYHFANFANLNQIYRN